jgi:hypothetical protein
LKQYKSFVFYRRQKYHDPVICGVTVVDGLRREPIRAEVAVKGGRIAAIGKADLLLFALSPRTSTRAGEMCVAIWLYPEDRRANHEPERTRSRFAT